LQFFQLLGCCKSNFGLKISQKNETKKLALSIRKMLENGTIIKYKRFLPVWVQINVVLSKKIICAYKESTKNTVVVQQMIGEYKKMQIKQVIVASAIRSKI
jgi:hypothetical protein